MLDSGHFILSCDFSHDTIICYMEQIHDQTMSTKMVWSHIQT